MNNAPAPRTVVFIAFVVLWLIFFWGRLSTLVQLSFHYENIFYSHAALIPMVTASILWLNRRNIFANAEYGLASGTLLLLAGGVLYWAGEKYIPGLNPNDNLALAIFSVVLIWMAGFALCYGKLAFRRATFPLLFLFFMVPIPSHLLERIILLLQKASADVAHLFFILTGVPVFQEGFIFSLPGINIEVAKQCSGFRSSLALLITGLIAGHFYLRSPWRKILLTLFIVPLVVVQNSLRIVILSLLAVYVDERFLTGSLHHHGGIVFFLFAVTILFLVLRLLQRSEIATQESPEPQLLCGDKPE